MSKKIVCLVPSLTHTIVDWGLRTELEGCTKFCIKPGDLHLSTAIIGGTKDPDIEAIEKLTPTHIVVNSEENKPEHIEALQKIAPVYISETKSIHNLPDQLRKMGTFLGASEAAEKTAVAIEYRTKMVIKLNQSMQTKSCLYFIWRNPYMVSGEDTYIQSLLSLAGYRNAYQGEQRYPELSIDEIKALRPDVLLLSSEPYPFRKRDHARFLEEWPECPGVLKADGMLLSWYGSMAVECLDKIKDLITSGLEFDVENVFSEFN
jgi:ABC-type Fe3+-hydroxamate transport system substrate-binding protein